MKKVVYTFILKSALPVVMLFMSSLSYAQHTFSIAAVDPTTGEIGSAAATCLDSEDGARDVSVIVLGVGSINTQSFWDPTNQANATTRMEAGDSPEEIITWLQNNDTNGLDWVPFRQYGIADIFNGSGRSAAFTGDENFDQKGHRLGDDYAIAGNILISQDVLDDMETAFVNSAGQALCDRLMAVMQAAKRPGADERCLDDGISSGSAYIRVAKPTDTDASYGNLWLDINVWLDSGTFTGDPIDELQAQFDDFKEGLSVEEFTKVESSVFPNPTNGIFTVFISKPEAVTSIDVYNALGERVISKSNLGLSNYAKLNLQDLQSGIYLVKLKDENNLVDVLKLIKR